jgi:hypothetical protein
MGFRYNDSPVIVHDKTSDEPIYDKERFAPSSWPGARTPHVLLKDGETSVLDLLKRGFNVIDFSKDGKIAGVFEDAGGLLKVPVHALRLPEEIHVAQIYERQAVIVRPDGHIGWRLPQNDDVIDLDRAQSILQALTGKR